MPNHAMSFVSALLSNNDHVPEPGVCIQHSRDARPALTVFAIFIRKFRMDMVGNTRILAIGVEAMGSAFR